jgi:ABC-type branched-subunit amino acid transport system substrate-binding protein
VNAMYARQPRRTARTSGLLLLASALAAPVVSAQANLTGFHLRIGVIAPSGEPDVSRAASIARGLTLGAGEANQTASLFGDRVELRERVGTGREAIAAAKEMLADGKVSILVGTTPSDADALSRLAESRHVIFFNAASRSQSLRSACRRYTFHVEATDAMYSNAFSLAMSGQAKVEGAVARSDSGSRESVVLWAQSLERFGASQLNQRYRDKYHVGMDGAAWAGWVAVKIAADAALRAQSTAPAKLLSYLESPSTQFDGHKGWPLTFRLADHQLRQPLYIVAMSPAHGTTPRLQDVPELHALRDDGTSDDSGGRGTDRVLDRLVASNQARDCGWTPK